MELPILERTSCKSLTACAEIQAAPQQLLTRLNQAKNMVARYGSGLGAGLVRLLPGGRSGKHVHVDCALRTFFPQGLLPKATHKKAEIIAILDEVIGSQLDVGVHACFEVPLQELPAHGLIRSLSAEEETAGISIKLTGGRFSMTGAPLQQVKWLLTDDGDIVKVEIGAMKVVEAKANYLQELLDWIDEQFKVFVLGRS